MSVELVGLAYDQRQTDAIWSRMPLSQVYDLILEDEFRRRVDLRSLLYHKGQLELLEEVEHFLSQGNESWTMVELMAARFRSGVEAFPSPTGELALDFRLIRHFSSLAVVEDFLVADRLLRNLLKKMGFLKDGAAWSLVETRDFDGVAIALRDARMKDVLEAGREENPRPSAAPLENLVRNYIEFLGYARNNGLTPFFYNSESDFRRWGDLVERKNRRSELVVDSSLRFEKHGTSGPASPAQAAKGTRTDDVASRLKRRRQAHALVSGLRDPDPLIRQKSVESLGRLAEAETLPHLIEALKDDEPEVRQELVRALAAIGGPQAEEVLLRVLGQDEVFSVRLIAAHGLCRMGSRAVIGPLLDAVEQGQPHFAVLLARHPAWKKDRAAKRRLETLVTHEEASVRRGVTFLLAQLDPNGQVAALNRLAADTDEITRVRALYSLWKLNAPGLARTAEEFASQPSPALAQAGAIVSGWVKEKVR